MSYDVHIEWGVRRPDGGVVPMRSEDIARGFAASSDRFTLVNRVVAHIEWGADMEAAHAEIDRLRAHIAGRTHDQVSEQHPDNRPASSATPPGP